MPWLHGLKARYEQPKVYLKNKPLSKSSDYFWNASKKLLEKKNQIPEAVFRHSVLKEHFAGDSFLVDLQLC